MYKILIADDEMIERMVLRKRLLENFGDRCEVIVAENGREVLKYYDEKKPDLMILDIQMPGVSGLEAAEQIRRAGGNCDIIFLTAFNEFDYAKKAISVHAFEYLLKPCDDKELILSVEEAMRNKNVSDPGSDEGNQLNDNTIVIHQNTAEAFLSYIEANYGKELTVQTMAEHFSYSEVYFCRLFKQHFGESFISFLTNIRIKKAIELLQTTGLSVKDIGRLVGYEDSNYFTKVFRRVTKCSPSEYKEKILKE
ncbi:response regulator [Butyrivibrio sp.]|uniref:response regulator transcription factor n=1 Tax=Butyrivibrio sp. TaxID=28121 RepID=UPI0025BBCB9D|nr:response regulator [Butyrivibrio sp.]MBQ9305819.1 response regulator [Butyrivibrio sp.]